MRLSKMRKEQAVPVAESKPSQVQLPPPPELDDEKPDSEDEGLLIVKEVIRPKSPKAKKQQTPKSHLPPEPEQKPVKAKKAKAEKPASKKVGGKPCEVIDCEGSDDMMFYERRIICAEHFNKLCAERDANPGKHLELENLFKLQPRKEKAKKAKGRRAASDSPWALARPLIVNMLAGAKEGSQVTKILEVLLKGGWQGPPSNQNLKTTLFRVLTAMIKEGLIIKAAKGRFGPVQ